MTGRMAERLEVTEVKWEHQEPGNGWLLRQVFDLLLREPELTSGKEPPTISEKTIEEEGVA